MEHVYSIPSLVNVQEKSGHNKVAVSAIVYINTKETFDHTFEQTEYDEKTSESKTVSKTESKTVQHLDEFIVNFDTTNIVSSKFVEWDDITEEQVIEWVKSSKDVSSLESEGAAIVAEKKDKILNPNKYKFDSPATPWVVRAIKEAAEAAEASKAEETN